MTPSPASFLIPFLSLVLSHPARGFALVSTPRAGLVSPASTRRCVTDEH